MKTLISIGVCLLLISCASLSPNQKTAVLTKQEAVERATREVEKKGWPLPAGYTTRAKKQLAIQEFRPTESVFEVLFYGRSSRGKRVLLYDVGINCASGDVHYALDMQRTSPGGR